MLKSINASKEAILVYVSLEKASLVIDQLNKAPLNIRKEGFSLRGDNIEEVKYMWTALMLLVPTFDKDFDHKKIHISGVAEFKFDPSSELGWFGVFSLNSIHHTVFQPILGNASIEWSKNDCNKEFGHLVPTDQVELKKAVQQVLCKEYLNDLFSIEDKGLSLRSKKISGLIKDIGITRIAQIFANIPSNIENINLDGMLNSLDILSITKIIKSIPPSAKSIRFYHDFANLGGVKQGAKTLLKIFENFPSGISKINLSLNDSFSDLGIDDLVKMITGIPKNVNELVLNSCQLYRLGVAALIKLFSALPTHVINFRICNNALNTFTGRELASVFHALPETVVFLDLSNNFLHSLKSTDTNYHASSAKSVALALAFSELPKKLNVLVLKDIYLTIDISGNSSVADNEVLRNFAEIFKNIPRSVTKLYLGESETYSKEPHSLNSQKNITLAKAFMHLPENTISPDTDLLKRARLGLKEVEEEPKQLKKIKDAKVQKLNRDLSELVQKFDATTRRVQSLLSEGASINCQTDDSKYTPLMLALDASNERLAEYLLANGANPLIKNKRGETARSFVSRNSPIYSTLKGYELLSLAMNNNLTSLHAIKMLLNTDISIVDFQGKDGSTAILIAVEQNWVELIEYILSKNPDLLITRDDGKGVLDLASNETITKMLVKHINANKFLEEDAEKIFDDEIFDEEITTETLFGKNIIDEKIIAEGSINKVIFDQPNPGNSRHSLFNETRSKKNQSKQVLIQSSSKDKSQSASKAKPNILNLLNQGSILGQPDGTKIKIKFNSLEAAKNFTTELLKIDFGDSNISTTPKQIQQVFTKQTANTKSEACYIVELTKNEIDTLQKNEGVFSKDESQKILTFA